MCNSSECSVYLLQCSSKFSNYIYVSIWLRQNWTSVCLTANYSALHHWKYFAGYVNKLIAAFLTREPWRDMPKEYAFCWRSEKCFLQTKKPILPAVFSYRAWIVKTRSLTQNAPCTEFEQGTKTSFRVWCHLRLSSCNGFVRNNKGCPLSYNIQTANTKSANAHFIVISNIIAIVHSANQNWLTINRFREQKILLIDGYGWASNWIYKTYTFTTD